MFPSGRSAGDKKRTPAAKKRGLLDSLVETQDNFNDLFSTKLIELVKHVDRLEKRLRPGRLALILAILALLLAAGDLVLLLRIAR